MEQPAGAARGPGGVLAGGLTQAVESFHFPASDHTKKEQPSEPIKLDPLMLFVKVKIHFEMLLLTPSSSG